MIPPTRPANETEWRAALDALPIPSSNTSSGGLIPSFFFGHGSPTLLMDTKALPTSFSGLHEMSGNSSRLAKFLSDFGPALISKYSPKAIVVFSAHWETSGEVLVSDYGDDQPLLMDYYGFSQALYEVEFHSNGDSQISQRVVEALATAGLKARKTSRKESRGLDGRGFDGPGLDHGVFVPFKYMFGDHFTSIPIVQVSICGNLSPSANYELGKAVSALRSEGILILSGGLTIHNLRDLKKFNEASAGDVLRIFHERVYESVEEMDPEKRRSRLLDLVNHPGFHQAHPRSEHFIPLYIAAGAGERGKPQIINAQFAAPTIAFGV